MALRFIQKSQLLKQTSIRQATRYFASESKQSAHHYPQESKLFQILLIDELKISFIAFGTNAWRNGVAIVVAGFVWYRIDQHLTQSGDVSNIIKEEHRLRLSIIGKAPLHKMDRISHDYK